MAKIWPVYEGRTPTMGEPWADIPLAEAVDLFELRPKDFLSDMETIPRFGPQDRDLTFAGYKHIVVELDRDEASRSKWTPGFYKSRIKPQEAFNRLIRQALETELGGENVVRLRLEPAADSQGRRALRITVVIPPEATKKLRKGAALDALVTLRQRLADMRDDRTPMVEYATEAELQDGGP